MKKIVISGASRGIGFALAHTISHSENAVFHLIARNESRLLELKAQLENNGSIAYVYPCDVSDKFAFQSALKLAATKAGNFDLVVLNAGISENKWILEKTYSETFENIFRVNVFSIAYALEILPSLMAKKGIIAIVSSLADVRGFLSSSAYCSSKSAVTRLAEAARVELKREGIDVLTIKPGFVRTDMTAKNRFPMPFLMEPEKAAKIIWTGILNRKKMISFPLPMVLLTKIISLLPHWLFDYFSSFYKYSEKK